MKKFTRIFALILCCVMVAGFAGCGGKQDVGDKTVIHFAASGVKASVSAYYQELIETYNATQGEIDKVYVEMVPTSEQISGLDVSLRSNYLYDVVEIGDGPVKLA